MAGFFSNTNAIHAQWKKLESNAALDSAISESGHKPVVLFKHSTRCIISASAKHRLEQNFNEIADRVSFYYLDLLVHRNVSNEIAAKLDVVHQSPQILVVKDGRSIFDTSHEGVSIEAISSHL